MKPDLTKISSVIFDLGGVIIDLDMDATYKAFAELSHLTFEEVKALAAKEDFFVKYEVGEIDDPTFRAHLREHLEFTGEDGHLDAAWNAMLGKIDTDKLAKIEQLADKYQLFVMSNTNEIHIRFFNRLVGRLSPQKPFHKYFNEVYLSQEVGERKPNPGAWQVILNDHQLSPESCLFIDDKLENIQAAEKLGIVGYQNVNPRDWLTLFA